MIHTLSGLKSYLEGQGIRTKSIKQGMLYMNGDDDYSSFKISVRDPESYDNPYHIMKEGLSGNVWGEDFATEAELADFIKEQKS